MSLKSSSRQQQKQNNQNNQNNMSKKLASINTLDEAKKLITKLRLKRNQEVWRLNRRVEVAEVSLAKVANDKQTLMRQLVVADKTVQYQKDYIVELEGKLSERSGVIGWFKRTFGL